MAYIYISQFSGQLFLGVWWLPSVHVLVFEHVYCACNPTSWRLGTSFGSGHVVYWSYILVMSYIGHVILVTDLLIFCVPCMDQHDTTLSAVCNNFIRSHGYFTAACTPWQRFIVLKGSKDFRRQESRCGRKRFWPTIQEGPHQRRWGFEWLTLSAKDSTFTTCVVLWPAMNAHANLMQDMTYYRTDNLIQKTASRVRYPCQTSVTSCLLAHIMLTAVESSDQWKVRKGDITVFGHDSQTMRHQQDAIRVCSYVKSYVVAAIIYFIQTMQFCSSTIVMVSTSWEQTQCCLSCLKNSWL